MSRKKRWFIKKLIVWLMAVMVCTSFIGFGAEETYGAVKTQASDGKNMTKTLKYFGEGKYKQAKKYNRKMNAVAKEPCIKKMSAKQKAAFKKTVRKWNKKQTSDGYSYLLDYYLTDINNDKKADLLILKGTCSADTKLLVYMYKRGKAKKVGTTWAGNASFYAYPNHNGIVMHYAHMGWESIYKISLKKGKLKTKEIGSREANNYFNLRCDLKGFVTYDSNYNRQISYKYLR